MIVQADGSLPAALSLEGITRRFGAVKALDAASLSVRAGTVHALLGENGAGKTTLMRVAFGLIEPNSGTIRVNGQVRRIASPREALAAGIGMVHQHFTLVPAMTVAENVALGSHGLFRKQHWFDRIRDIGQRTGLALNPDARVSDLPVGAQQRCEIVKALARDVRILILDEPTAVLAPAEAQELLRWVRSYANEGNSAVLITHKLRDALLVADDVTVLRRGVTVLSKPVRADSASTLLETELAAAMIGTHNAEHSGQQSVLGSEQEAPHSGAALQLAATVGRTPPGERGAVVLEAKGASLRDALGILRVNNVSIQIRAGELVGIAAIEGSGQHELLRLLARRITPTSGTVTAPPSLGFVPEDRHNDALMLDATLVENIALHNAAERSGRMPWRTLERETAAIIAERDVRVENIEALARTLSGGNQQKLIVGRELVGKPGAMIVENPTRGLDFRASEAVHEALREARDSGTAIVFYSSDLDEVLALADRVVVMQAGSVREVAGNREEVGRAMLDAPRPHSIS